VPRCRASTSTTAVADPAGPIAVYGASGYTGRLVVRELVRRGLAHLLAGRTAARLRAAASDAGSDAPVRIAALEDRDALRHALGDCAVVINCAGPFTRWGEAVVRAAVETGTHYLDTTGEQPYMHRIAQRWDQGARAAEVAVVPAMGFDFVPGDLLAHLVARGREPLRDLVIAYSVQGFGATRGTLHSTLEAMKGDDLRYEDGAWLPAGPGPRRGVFTFPEPIGRAPVMKYPAGEIVTAPTHVNTRRVTALIDTRAMVPHPALALAAPSVMPATARALRTPLRSALDVVVDRLPEGPPEAARRAARFTVVVVAAGEDGRVGRGVVTGSDMYGLTAAIAVEGAQRMSEPGFVAAGVLAPAAAFNPESFLDALGEHGVSYEIEAE
jgi:short subunit dehydrogenase-like uncharacterized protein